MSLVLAIMGTIAGFSLPLLLEQKSTQKRQRSLQNIDLVLSALGTYAASHQSLPCPASLTSKGLPQQCTATDIIHAHGIVPYKVLGISEASAKDGFGKPLRYALDPHLSQRAHFAKEHSSKLKIDTPDGESVCSDAKSPPAVILIAEGEAYQNPQSSFELKNTAPDLSFVDAPYNVTLDTPFRHVVRWSSRDFLLTYYGKSSPPLKEVQTSKTNEENDPPSGARASVNMRTDNMSADSAAPPPDIPGRALPPRRHTGRRR